VSSVPNVLVVHSSQAVRTLSELLVFTRSRPGQLNYASAGSGSSTHPSMELLRNMAGLDVVHVPYKGSGPAMFETQKNEPYPSLVRARLYGPRRAAVQPGAARLGRRGRKLPVEAGPVIGAGPAGRRLIALAQKRRHALSYATPGKGSAPHLVTKLFKSLSRMRIMHAPNRGAPPAHMDLLDGQVTMYFGTIRSAIAHIKSARLRGLATTGTRRSPVLPRLPTVAESGRKDFIVTTCRQP